MEIKKYIIKEIVKNVVYGKLLEENIVKIVEERGMFSDYKNLIMPIIKYINNYLKSETPNEKLINGKYVIYKYVVKIPDTLLKQLTWIENKNLIIEIIDLSDDLINEIGVENITKNRKGQQTTSMFDRLTKDNKLEKLEMKINGYSLNKQVFPQNIQSSLYHEFTHAFENYNKLKKGGGLFYDLYNTNYSDISKWKVDNNIFKYVNYYLLNKTELSANIAGVYGDLERINSIRKNFSKDIKETDAYKNYYKIRNDLIPKLMNMGDSEWENFRKQTFEKYLKTPEVKVFKNDFLKFTNLKLNDLFRGIGKVASQYYDDIENQNNFNNTSLDLN